MKKIFTLLIGIVLSITILNAQEAPPQAFSFKATIKDKYGLPVLLKKINLRITILQGDIGFAVYSEYFTPTTDLYSQVDIQIGRGTVLSGNFSSIGWSANKYFLKIEVDIKGGSNYQLLSVTQLLSVPYALYAGKAGSSANAFSGNYYDLYNKPINLSQFNNNVGFLTNEFDPIFSAHPVHGITSLNIANWNTAFNWGNHAGLYRPIGYVPAWVEITDNPININTPIADQLLKYNAVTSKWENWTPNYLTTEVDGDPTNELQSLSIEGNVISLNKGGGSVTLPSASTSIGQYYYRDKDNDGYGDTFLPVWVPTGVTPPTGFLLNLGDCNDNDSSIHPGANEICGDGIDQDCNGSDLACESWGTLVSDNVPLTIEQLQSSEPSLLDISFTCDVNFNHLLLGTDAQTVYNDYSTGGSARDSRSLGMEVLKRLANATLFSTESQIGYIDAGGQKTDMIVTIENLKIGIKVGKAYHYPPLTPYTLQEAAAFLTGSLNDILTKSQNLMPDYVCVKYILLVYAFNAEYASQLSSAWGSIDSSIKANTIVLIVTTEGDDFFLYQ